MKHPRIFGWSVSLSKCRVKSVLVVLNVDCIGIWRFLPNRTNSLLSTRPTTMPKKTKRTADAPPAGPARVSKRRKAGDGSVSPVELFVLAENGKDGVKQKEGTEFADLTGPKRKRKERKIKPRRDEEDARADEEPQQGDDGPASGSVDAAQKFDVVPGPLVGRPVDMREPELPQSVEHDPVPEDAFDADDEQERRALPADELPEVRRDGTKQPQAVVPAPDAAVARANSQSTDQALAEQLREAIAAKDKAEAKTARLRQKLATSKSDADVASKLQVATDFLMQVERQLKVVDVCEWQAVAAIKGYETAIADAHNLGLARHQKAVDWTEQGATAIVNLEAIQQDLSQPRAALLALVEAAKRVVKHRKEVKLHRAEYPGTVDPGWTDGPRVSFSRLQGDFEASEQVVANLCQGHDNNFKKIQQYIEQFKSLAEQDRCLEVLEDGHCEICEPTANAQRHNEALDARTSDYQWVRYFNKKYNADDCKHERDPDDLPVDTVLERMFKQYWDFYTMSRETVGTHSQACHTAAVSWRNALGKAVEEALEKGYDVSMYAPEDIYNLIPLVQALNPGVDGSSRFVTQARARFPYIYHSRRYKDLNLTRYYDSRLLDYARTITELRQSIEHENGRIDNAREVEAWAVETFGPDGINSIDPNEREQTIWDRIVDEEAKLRTAIDGLDGLKDEVRAHGYSISSEGGLRMYEKDVDGEFVQIYGPDEADADWIDRFTAQQAKLRLLERWRQAISPPATPSAGPPIGPIAEDSYRNDISPPGSQDQSAVGEDARCRSEWNRHLHFWRTSTQNGVELLLARYLPGCDCAFCWNVNQGLDFGRTRSDASHRSYEPHPRHPDMTTALWDQMWPRMIAAARQIDGDAGVEGLLEADRPSFSDITVQNA